MKKAVFFQRDKQSQPLSVVITNENPENLVGKIIPEGCKYLAVEFDNPTKEDKIKFTHVDKVLFNDYENPTKLILNSVAFSESIVDKIRAIRIPILAQLDSLQTRALIKGKTELVEEIEQDKQYLRDCTDKIKSRNFSKISELNKKLDPALTTDYEAKYGKKILE